MTTPWKPVNFNTEPLNATKLQQLSNNTQYLFDRAAKIRYQNNTLIRDTGVKMLTGKAYIPPSATASLVRQPVYFSNFFTAGCRPIIVTSYESYYARCSVAITGFSGASPDHVGFNIAVSSEHHKKINFGMRVHWLAIGY